MKNNINMNEDSIYKCVDTKNIWISKCTEQIDSKYEYEKSKWSQCNLWIEKFKKLRETKKSSQKSNGYETTNQIMCNQENDAQSQTNKENKTHY
jgi:hypothetical protein